MSCLAGVLGTNSDALQKQQFPQPRSTPKTNFQNLKVLRSYRNKGNYFFYNQELKSLKL